VSQENNQQVDDALIGVLCKQALQAWVLSVGVVVIAVVILHEQASSAGLTIWTLLMVLCIGIRLPQVLEAHSGDLKSVSSANYHIRLAGMGALYGSMPLLSGPEMPVSAQLFLVTIPMGVCLGAILAFSAWLPTFSIFVLSLKIPFVLSLLYTDVPGYKELVVMSLVLFGMVAALSIRINRQTRASFALRYVNEQLLEDLSRQNKNLAQARDEAQEACKMKDQFLARMSHELRTPMNGVLGMAQLLDGTALEATQKSWLNKLQISGGRMLDLVNDLLEASSLSTGEINLVNTNVNVAQLFNDMQQRFGDEIETRGLGFSVDIDQHVPERVITDATRLKQILIKLLDNALKFTRAGEITVHVSFTDRQSLAVIVSDTGVGIDSAEVENAGALFHQADGDNNRRYDGSGLGLSIVTSVLRLMSGTFSITSEKGNGTQVCFCIPVQVSTAASESVGQTRDAGDTARAVVPVTASLSLPTKVLVAEDNMINQLVIETMLEDFNCDVTLADDGNEAIENLLSNDFDIVFMDVQMPDCDGYEATRQARTAGKQVPIVAVTANTLVGDREKCLSAGMNDYVGKPFTQSGIAQMLARWANRTDLALEEINDAA